jgi:ribonuclease PH
VALAMGLGKLQAAGKIPGKALIDTVAAVSVGMKGSDILADLDYNEDSSCDVDMNFVVTGKGLFVEIQGTAEKQGFTKSDMDKMTESALGAIEQLRRAQFAALAKLGVSIG